METIDEVRAELERVKNDAALRVAAAEGRAISAETRAAAAESARLAAEHDANAQRVKFANIEREFGLERSARQAVTAERDSAVDALGELRSTTNERLDRARRTVRKHRRAAEVATLAAVFCGAYAVTRPSGRRRRP